MVEPEPWASGGRYPSTTVRLTALYSAAMRPPDANRQQPLGLLKPSDAARQAICATPAPISPGLRGYGKPDTERGRLHPTGWVRNPVSADLRSPLPGRRHHVNVAGRRAPVELSGAIHGGEL